MQGRHADSLLQNYEKEVQRGWMLPTTFECVTKLKGGVIPVGVASQFIIDDKGNRKRTLYYKQCILYPSIKKINQ